MTKELPTSWRVTTLGEVTYPRGLRMNPSEMKDAPFIGLQHVEPHTMRLIGMGSASDVRSSAAYFAPGDVLYGRLRPYLNKVYRPSFQGLASGEFIVFPHQRSLDNTYLQYFLNQWEFVSAVTRMNTGDRPRVNFDQFAEFPFPLPPLPEQRRIVAEIEKQFTRLDASVDGLKRAQANLKRYRASVLKAACEGKLVPTEAELARSEGRDYEPADRLLERILAERRAQWGSQKRHRGKYKDPTAPETCDLAEMPEGWVWSNLGESFEVHVGATPRRSRPDFWNGEIAWASSGEVSFNRIKKTRECITEAGVANSSVNVHPTGTVLLGMIGEGKTRGQVSILDIPAGNSQNSAAIRVSQSGLPPEYVFYYLWGQYDSTRRIGSGNNQPALNKSRVQLITLPVPPLAEQHRIVAEVERHLSVIQNAEAVVDASLKRANRLRQSILKQAFSGQARTPGPGRRTCVGASWSASGPSVPWQRPRQKPSVSQGDVAGRSRRPQGSSASQRRIHDHFFRHRPKALELLQRAPRRGPFLWRLP